MPRVLMDVSERWLKRFQVVVPIAIDTLTGFEAQIMRQHTVGDISADDLLQMMHQQIVDLRRNLETVRIIF